jgi:hypothetical protein
VHLKSGRAGFNGVGWEKYDAAENTEYLADCGLCVRCRRHRLHADYFLIPMNTLKWVILMLVTLICSFGFWDVILVLWLVLQADQLVTTQSATNAVLLLPPSLSPRLQRH